jgi:dephospho-CoA kinase
MLWPRVGARVAEWRTGLDRLDPEPRAAIVEVPLLFESGMEAVFDRTVAVIADEAVRAARAGGRGHEGVEGRTSAQLSQEEKSQRANYTVRNDGTLEELEEKLSELLDSL